MPRLPRFDDPGSYHHVVNRGACHQDTFLDPTDRRLFLSLLAEAVARFGVEVHAFCLMNNHFHLVLRSPEGGIGEAMQFLLGRYTALFNHRHGRDGALFRGRYRSKRISTDSQLMATLRYVHRNPTKDFGIHPDDYPWSSHGAYTLPSTSPEWLCTRELLAIVGSAAAYSALIFSPLGDEHAEQTLPRGWNVA